MTRKPQTVEHPLSAPRPAAALAVASVWTLGVSLMDSRLSLGALLCLFSAIVTLWIFADRFRFARIMIPKTWPWIGIFIIFTELLFPVFVFMTQSRDEIYAPNSDHRPMKDDNRSEPQPAAGRYPQSYDGMSVKDNKPAHQENAAGGLQSNNPSIGILIEGGGSNRFDGVVIDGVDRAIEMKETTGNSFKNLQLKNIRK